MRQKPIALILAAGQGTRMKSDRAKVLHEVAGRPLIAWAILAAKEAAASRIIVVLGHQRDEVTAVIREQFGDEIEIAIQEQQRGTGDAVIAGLTILADEPDDAIVVVLSGDVPRFRGERIAELTEATRSAPGKMALVSARTLDPSGYGRIVRSSEGGLAKIVEHADATTSQRAIDEINAGFYGFGLGLLRSEISTLTVDNAQGELYLTDVGERAAKRGQVPVLEVPFDDIRGINTRVDLAEVEASARGDICHRWMLAGVTIVDPKHTYIDVSVEDIGQDTWIGPGVCLRGNTSIGRRVRIDTCSVLANVIIGDDTWIKPHSVLGDSKVGELVQIGPFAHCRPGTVLDERVKVGNFVETKKTHIMAGAKASHLAYLGDASIGQGANVGAGTITCNYDGFNKHRTTIEAGAFIGTDSQLVAPVTVGRNAYVGAGTTVTKDVPRSSLALSRTKQVNVEGWADRFREAQRKRMIRKTNGESS